MSFLFVVKMKLWDAEFLSLSPHEINGRLSVIIAKISSILRVKKSVKLHFSTLFFDSFQNAPTLINGSRSRTKKRGTKSDGKEVFLHLAADTIVKYLVEIGQKLDIFEVKM